jgi:hypothetical protein
VYPQRRQQVFDRANGRCEAIACDGCTRDCEQVHHVAGRGGDDPHRLDNLLGCCAPCHEWIHRNPAAARAGGWMRSRLELDQ